MGRRRRGPAGGALRHAATCADAGDRGMKGLDAPLHYLRRSAIRAGARDGGMKRDAPLDYLRHSPTRAGGRDGGMKRL
jgi:hypothetical protein